MKYIFALICLAMTNSAMAHEDHALGESVHVAYHIAFWSLCALVAYKGIIWFKTEKILNKDR
jgi:hypothetical protein